LIGGVDETGTHLFETCPSANFYEYKAMAIGAKCQSAKTYLEKNFESFAPLGKAELVKHGLKALRASAQEEELTVNNVSVGVVSKDEKFRLFDATELADFLAQSSDAMIVS
jgi:20S proteasome subunit alpha 6